ncbi:MAG: hypothetical protein ACKV0T_19630, partial [Planctomycetales bacterium]
HRNPAESCYGKKKFSVRNVQSQVKTEGEQKHAEEAEKYVGIGRDEEDQPPNQVHPEYTACPGRNISASSAPSCSIFFPLVAAPGRAVTSASPREAFSCNSGIELRKTRTTKGLSSASLLSLDAKGDKMPRSTREFHSRPEMAIDGPLEYYGRLAATP